MKKNFTLLSLALKNLRRKPLRSLILVVSIGLMVSSLVFFLSFVIHVNSTVKRAADRLGADILIVPTGSRSYAEDVLLENKIKTFYMDREILERVKRIKGIETITPQTYLTTMPALCCSVPEAVIIAFDQKTDFVIKPWLQKKIQRPLNKGEAIAGHESAFSIRVGLMEVDTTLLGNTFKILGVLDKTGTGLDNAVLISDENIPDIIFKGTGKIKPGQISIIFARVEKGYDPYEVGRSIDDSIIEVDAVARKDIGKNILNTLTGIRSIFSVSLILVGVLSLFLTWSVFSAVANERAREIGIMKAIGANESHIIRFMLTEVLILGAAGSIFGILSGGLAFFAFQKGFAILKNFPVDFSLINILTITLTGLVLGTGICIAGSIAPVFRMKNLEPLLVIKES